MKRKQGHKKGKKSKKSKTVTEQENSNESTGNAENQTSEQSSEALPECENSEHESKMEVDSPSPTRSGNSPIASFPVASASPGAPADNVAAKSVGRVKVKLKTSKAAEPDETLRNDFDKSSSQVESEKPAEAAEKKEDVELEPPLPGRKPVFLNVYRKTKGIRIKNSKAVDGSTSVTEKSADEPKPHDAIVLQKDIKTPDENLQANKQEPEKAPTPISLQNEQKKTDQISLYNKQEPEKAPTPISLQNEQKEPDQNSLYNKQELEDSLTVIKKIMKMDAADPFNVPVNPEALGIPDYFDIIKTPMDFGTICTNFEKDKYMNSEDVYKDVQYIWNNCSKYNKKGDYIVDLMKRVKKNFMKYWTAAGLYTEQSLENNQLEDGGKSSTKGSQSKHKSHKRHGRHHKSDCMCAICVLKRRKRERERDAQGHSGAQQSSPAGSPSVDNSSINMGEEQDMDIDVHNENGQEKTEIVELDSPVSKRQRVNEDKQEMDDKEIVEVESENKTGDNIEDKTQSTDRLIEETGDEPVTSAAEKSVILSSVEGSKSTQDEKEEKEKRLRERKELRELEHKEWRVKMHEKYKFTNPQLLSLSEALFPNNNSHNSIWNGPHSLFKPRGGSNRSSSVHKAVEALLKL